MQHPGRVREARGQKAEGRILKSEPEEKSPLETMNDECEMTKG